MGIPLFSYCVIKNLHHQLKQSNNFLKDKNFY